MARIFQTGWEMGYNISDIVNGGSVSTAVTAGSWSTYSFHQAGFFSSSIMSLGGGTYSELYVGYRFFGNNTIADDELLWDLLSATPTSQVSLVMNAGAKLEANRGGYGGTILGTGSTTFAADRWYYIEAHIIISDTVGVFEVKVDGTQEINVTGADTRADAGTATVDRIRLSGGASNSTDFYMDDLYVNDTTGSTNTGYSGDIRISAYIPNAAGDVTGLTASAGSNYACVDERPPNTTDYVYDSGTTNYDLYNIPDTSGVTTVQAATLWLRAQKSDAGAKNIAHKIKSASTEDTGSDVALSTSWTYYGKVYNIDPTDSAAWTPTKINDLQIGAKAR